MEIRFKDKRLDRLETDTKFHGGNEPAVVKAYRKRIQMIRAAPDEQVFYQLKSLRFEKLKGNRKHQHSMRLNDQWRLIIELDDSGQKRTVVIVGIEDYH